MITIHGFSCNKQMISHHAKNISGADNSKCMTININMSSLMYPSPSKGQQQNIDNIIELVLMFSNNLPSSPNSNLLPSNLPKINPSEIYIVGHSAGGSVALEAAYILSTNKGIYIKGVCLLDAVPWPRTEQLIENELLGDAYNPLTVDLPRMDILSIRGAKSVWNLNGRIGKCLFIANTNKERNSGDNSTLPVLTEVYLPKSRHGDPLSLGIINKIRWFPLGLFSNISNHGAYERLVSIFTSGGKVDGGAIRSLALDGFNIEIENENVLIEGKDNL